MGIFQLASEAKPAVSLVNNQALDAWAVYAPRCGNDVAEVRRAAGADGISIPTSQLRATLHELKRLEALVYAYIGDVVKSRMPSERGALAAMGETPLDRSRALRVIINWADGYSPRGTFEKLVTAVRAATAPQE